MPHKKEGVSSEGFIFFDHYYEIGRNGYTTNNDYQDSNVDYLYEPFYKKMTVTLNVSYDPYKVNETIR